MHLYTRGVWLRATCDNQLELFEPVPARVRTGTGTRLSRRHALLHGDCGPQSRIQLNDSSILHNCAASYHYARARRLLLIIWLVVHSGYRLHRLTVTAPHPAQLPAINLIPPHLPSRGTRQPPTKTPVLDCACIWREVCLPTRLMSECRIAKFNC